MTTQSPRAATDGAVAVSDEDTVRRILINRPGCLNALNSEAVVGIAEALCNLPGDIHAVVISGAGDRAFSSGHDLQTPPAETQTDARRGAEDMQQITRCIRSCPVPVIAAVRGYAVGAGAELALTCDLVVAADDAKFIFPEVEVGLVVTNGLTSLLPRTVGPARAKEILFFGTPIDAETALDLGLVNRVVPVTDLGATVDQLVEQVKAMPAHSLARAKQLVDYGFDRNLDLTLVEEVRQSVDAETSPEGQAALSSYAESHL